MLRRVLLPPAPGVHSTVTGLMDLESESEVEEEERPCEAVKVGVMIKGTMRPLAPDGCRDAAGPVATVLLTVGWLTV